METTIPQFHVTLYVLNNNSFIDEEITRGREKGERSGYRENVLITQVRIYSTVVGLIIYNRA